MAAFLDGCRFTPTAGGTTDWTYSVAVTGYQSPAAANAVNGTVYKYRAESTDLSQWELGEGAYNTSTGVLARATVLFNSLGTTSKINFSSVPQVAIVALKEDLLSVEEANGFSSGQKAQARTNLGLATIAASGSASDLSVGTVPTVRLGSGTANSSSFLRGDQAWASALGLVEIDTYTTSQTITIPAGATRAFIRFGGCGGGSGGSTGTNRSAGAGSGAYLEKYLTGLTPGNTLALTIGTPGAAGTATPGAGGNGVSSTLASGTQTISTLTVPGGSGTGVGSGTATLGGAGGAIATGGDLNMPGHIGDPIIAVGSAKGGMGGPSVGISGAGGDGVTTTAGNAGGPATCVIQWYS